MSDIAIKVENVSKIYPLYHSHRDRLKEALHPFRKKYHHDFYALNDVSFEVKKGETVGIIGRNGSGKSTLLSIIAGVLHPSSGSVTVNGRISSLLELGAGFNPELTGIENVYFYGLISGLTKEAMDEKVEDILSFADIGEFIEQPVKTYSSGMLMRLAFAVVAHVDADILIVDEALSVGDAVFVQKCSRFLRGYLERGTLLFVSHSMQSVLELCDRVIWLKEGKTRMDSYAKEVVQHYNAFVHQQINVKTPIRVEVPKPNITNSLRSSISSEQPAVPQFRADVFAFDPETPYWGAGGAEITNIVIQDSNGQQLKTINGGELITIRVSCISHQELIRPIIGFNIRNQRGIEILSDNTRNFGDQVPSNIPSGTQFDAIFRFFLPYLAVGEYFLGGAVADRQRGEVHLQHHRRDDALRISVICSHVVYGVFSMPMEKCAIEVRPVI